ncbi:MAG: HAMP domain-containing histidine kinase [Ruminococcus sp.]|nr:HAMP domain-containing histidine kinase [Ruminococcus sp.]
MIKRLRRNIILINVIFVGIVLFIILSIFCINNYINIRTDTEHNIVMLSEQITEDRKNPNSPEIGKRKSNKNDKFMDLGQFVIIELDKNGNITNIVENNAKIENDVVNSIVNDILKEGNKIGEKSEYRLMYAKSENINEIKIVLTDTSKIYSSLFRDILICIGLFAGGLIVIFIISLVLSYFAVKPVKTAWEQQKQFVADASHELKTPLTVILANNNILMSHSKATIEQERKWLESTDEEAKHMKKLIDQMLYLAKSDAEQIKPEITSINLSEIAEGTVLNFEPIAYEKEVVINTNINTDIFIKGDFTMLNQLAHILIDNAVKYADNGGNINIELFKKSDKCILKVTNSGDIISSDELAHLFDRFYRTDKARTKGGYGLGLSIAYNIVHTLNGKIFAESNENGTTFTVELPC